MPLFGFGGPPNIEKLKSKRDVKGLIRALKYRNDPLLQSEAARILGNIGDVRGVQPLLNAVKDGNFSAAEALKQIKSVEAVEPLIAALKDKDSKVRSAASVALGIIGDNHAVEPLISVLKDRSESVRISAATALGSIGDKRAVEPLIAALKDKDSKVRSAASVALGIIGDNHAVEPLISVLNDEYESVRISAATALGNIGDKRAIEPLFNAFMKDPKSTRAGLERLGWQPSNDMQRAVLAIEDGQWEQLRTDGTSAVKPLLNFLNRGASFSTREAISTLEKILEQTAESMETESLHQIIDLKDALQIRNSTTDCGFPTTETVKADCSHVRQLARQELIRRGEQA